MSPIEEVEEEAPDAQALVPSVPQAAVPYKPISSTSGKDVDEWVNDVDEVTAQIRGIIDGTITDFDAFDKKLHLKARAKQIREEEAKERRERFFLYGTEGKGEGTRYKWWCKRCFVEYLIDLPDNNCTRCKQSDKMMSQEARREELMGKVEDFKKGKATHMWRKDKWQRWKKSQALLGRSRNINYKAWEYWEPDTDTEDEGEPIVPKHDPGFQAMEADMNERRRKACERSKTAEACRKRGNQAMQEGDFIGAIEHYQEGLEYRRDSKALWTNKALAEVKVFRWHDAIASCNKVIEYAEIFEDGFTKSADACFKAFTRRAIALRGLHKWKEAAENLEDALKLCPKDREARELLEKTRLACEEARRVEELRKRKESQEATATPAGAPVAPATPPAPRPVPSPDAVEPGQVRVPIEESDDDEDEEALPAVHAGSLAGLRKADYEALLRRLRGGEAERTLFCARRGGGGPGPTPKAGDQWIGRKIELKVEEVEEPSALDGVLKDADRCCIIWKKSQRMAISKQAHEEEDLEAMRFLQLAAPRLLAVLHILASCSDHHCQLTAPAVRHVWPLLSYGDCRLPVLELLLEWSQRSVTAKAMAEFAGRYPDPHLQWLIDAVTQEAREDVLPPGFEDRARRAAERLERGAQSADAALQEMLEGLTMASPVEMAISTLGNLCLAGQYSSVYKEQLAPYRETIVGKLKKHIRALDWRLCGRAAGALCNLIRLGEPFAQTVHEQCLEQLVQALREECQPGDMPSMGQVLQQLGGDSPLRLVLATGRILGALVNLLVIRPQAVQQVRELGALNLTIPLINPEVDAVIEGDGGDGSDGGPPAVVARAALLTSRLLSSAPDALSLEAEADLLRRLHRILERAGSFAGVRAAVREDVLPEQRARALEPLELAVRMLTIVLTKTPGSLNRLARAVPRFEELPDDAEGLPPLSEPAISLQDLTQRLLSLASALRPREHVGPDEVGAVPSRLRGNLALLLAGLCEAQAQADAAPLLAKLDFSPLVEVAIDCLRKERGAAQHNVGVCVTRLAQNPRYRQQVRDLNGIESLHQIQLPKVEAQKAQAQKMHRIETSVEARKAEIHKIKEAKAQKAMG